MKRTSSPHAVDLPSHGIYTFESHHSGNFSMKEAVWPFHKLCYVATGKGRVETGSRNQKLQPGDVFYVPPHLPHRFVDQASAPLTLMVICFQTSVVSESTAMKEMFTQFLSCQSPIQVFNLAKYIQDRIREDMRTLLIEQQLRKAGWAVATTSVLGNLLVYLTRVIPLRERTNLQDHFNLTVAYIEDNFFRKIRSADLAAMCNVSERTYSGVFKKRMGMTVTAFIQQCRIGFAKERLEETGNIAYAAYESGFSDLAHFYRVFKKMVGVPPGVYIEQTQVATQK